MRTLRWLLVALASLAVFPALASAQSVSLLPLEYGRTWELRDSSGGIWKTRVAEHTTLNSLGVWVLKRTTPDGRIWNYWSEAADGTIRLHGFLRPDENVGAIYDPPLEWIRPTPLGGTTWQTDCTVLDYASGQAIGGLHLTVVVGESLVRSLAQGDFTAWPHEYSLAMPKLPAGSALAALNAFGESTATPDGTILRQEYCLEHGLIREVVCCPGDVRLLESESVPTSSETWSTLKSVYGDPR